MNYRHAQHRYLNALDYAKNRVQGADLTQMLDKTVLRVSIIHHPDVRRSLMLQKSYAGHARPVLYTAMWQDKGRPGPSDRRRDDMAERINDPLLLPSSRASALSVRTRCSRSRCRPSVVPASCRTTRSKAVHPVTPRSTLCMRAPRRSRVSAASFRKMVRDQFQAITKVAAEIHRDREHQRRRPARG